MIKGAPNRFIANHAGRKVSEEKRRKISLAVKKLWSDPAYRENSILRHRGKPGYWTGKAMSEESKVKQKEFRTGKKLSEEHKAKIRIRMNSKEVIEKTSAAHRGRKQTKEEIGKRAAANKRAWAKEGRREQRRNAQIGAKSHFWKGGVTPLNTIIRNRVEMAIWKKSVFERDRYLCQKCNDGGYLNAHHLLNFSDFPELRFDRDNGLTLCRGCHLGFHNRYGRESNDFIQMLSFLNG